MRLLFLMLLFLVAAGGRASAQDQAPRSCAGTIRAVLTDIAARDLDTSTGPPLNAFLTLNPSALAQAEALDRAVAAGAPKGPLFCTPVGVKDNFDTYDTPTTVGSLALVGNQPPADAPFVARLRAAGAIIVGKTNMDEFAMGISGISGAGGRVGNAYDPRQSAGGSSSGSGVAVAAGFVPIALGSDNCGSLRVPAAYNGVVSVRATFGRFNTDGIFPIGFVDGVPGVITRDATTLNAALAIVGDGWRPDEARNGTLSGKRIGVLRRYGGRNPWAAADPETQALFARTIALIRREGAAIVEDVTLDDVDVRLGPDFLKGFARRVDASLARYPSSRRTWREVCASGRIRPEWTARECMALAASSARDEQRAVDQIARNQQRIVATLDRLRLDALLYPVDGRGGARDDVSNDIACFVASTSGLPAAAFPVALDARGLPVGMEILGRPNDDEKLVALMAAFERARGAFPPPPRTPGSLAVATLDVPRQNALRLRLGWTAYKTRHGKSLGALVPERFRDLTASVIREELSSAGQHSAPQSASP